MIIFIDDYFISLWEGASHDHGCCHLDITLMNDWISWGLTRVKVLMMVCMCTCSSISNSLKQMSYLFIINIIFNISL